MDAKETIAYATVIAVLLVFAKALICSVWDFIFEKPTTPTEIVKTDTLTIVKTDTFFVEKPTEIVRYVYKHDTTIVNIIDTSGNLRPATAIIPIERTIYHDSTKTATYTAYLSGYRTALDSITINCQSVSTVITNTERIPASRFGIGLQVGVGFSAQGLAAPYVGIGVQYRLWPNK